MSNGTYCSASQRIDSESSSSGIAGSWIFLMMTECPETETADVRVLDASRGEEAGDRLDDERGVHDRAVDDGFRAKGSRGPALDELELAFLGLP